MKSYEITLPTGGNLLVDATPVFMQIVADKFGCQQHEVTHDQIRKFIWESVNNAITKAEKILPQ